jgi:hypothetical protein
MSSETDHYEIDTETQVGHYFDRPLSKATGYDQAPEPDVFGRVPATSREIAEATRLPQARATLELVDASNPWHHLPSGAFSIENGRIVAFQESESSITRRRKEDMLATPEPDAPLCTSIKRQTKRARSSKNDKKPRGGIRPRPGGR